jgi:hypothetical protein
LLSRLIGKIQQPHREVGSVPKQQGQRVDRITVQCYVFPTRDHGAGHAIIWKNLPSCRQHKFWIYPSGRTLETLLWDDWRQFCTNCTLAFLEGTPQASSKNYSLQRPVVKHYDVLANVIEVSFSLLDWVKYHDPHSF